jgi:hypothetical protein
MSAGVASFSAINFEPAKPPPMMWLFRSAVSLFFCSVSCFCASSAAR